MSGKRSQFGSPSDDESLLRQTMDKLGFKNQQHCRYCCEIGHTDRECNRFPIASHDPNAFESLVERMQKEVDILKDLEPALSREERRKQNEIEFDLEDRIAERQERQRLRQRLREESERQEKIEKGIQEAMDSRIGNRDRPEVEGEASGSRAPTTSAQGKSSKSSKKGKKPMR